MYFLGSLPLMNNQEMTSIGGGNSALKDFIKKILLNDSYIKLIEETIGTTSGS